MKNLEFYDSLTLVISDLEADTFLLSLVREYSNSMFDFDEDSRYFAEELILRCYRDHVRTLKELVYSFGAERE